MAEQNQQIVNKFNHSKIYKLVNTVNDNVFVGSTISKHLWATMGVHVLQCDKGSSLPLYDVMKQVGVKNFKIVLIEEYNCNTKDQLKQREQHWIDILKPAYNYLPVIRKPRPQQPVHHCDLCDKDMIESRRKSHESSKVHQRLLQVQKIFENGQGK